MSIHLGTSIDLMPKEADIGSPLELHLGYAFESKTIPDDRYSVFLADGDKHVLAGGTTYRMNDLSFDASLSLILTPSRTITDSAVTQINSTDPDNRITTIVANGSYDQTFLLVGLGTEYRF